MEGWRDPDTQFTDQKSEARGLEATRPRPALLHWGTVVVLSIPHVVPLIPPSYTLGWG